MKIEGKDLKEFKDVKSLGEAVEITLDELALNLQKFTLMVQESDAYSFNTKCLITSAYLNSIMEINRQYSTNYAAHIDKIRAHFKKPARD